MLKLHSVLLLMALLLSSQLSHASKEDATDNARVKTLVGVWQVGDEQVLNFTDHVEFTTEIGDYVLTFYRIEGAGAAYSVAGNQDSAILFMKFEDEPTPRILPLVIKNKDLFTTEAPGGVVEWRRLEGYFDLTDYELVKKIAGYWRILEVSGDIHFFFGTDVDRVENLPGVPYKMMFHTLNSPELGEQSPWKSYSVVRYLGRPSELWIFASGARGLGQVSLEGNELYLDGKRFAVRSSAPQIVDSASKDYGSLGVKVTFGKVLGLTATKFEVRLEGDESTGFVREKDHSGSALLQSGYAWFEYLPPGKYKLLLSGHESRGGEIIPFSMSLAYDFPGGRVICAANVSDMSFYCQD